MNCGPTAILMASACITGGSLGYDGDEITALISWMDDNIPTYDGVGEDYNGNNTNIDELATTASSYLGIEAEAFSSGSLDALYAQLYAGRPVVVAVPTQGSNNDPSDVMVAGYGHFMLLVGMTPTHVILNDPGRSASSNADHRDYTIESFLTYWEGSGVSFGEVTGAVSGDITSCTVVDSTLSLAGYVTSSDGVEKWSITVDDGGSPLAEGYPGIEYAEVNSEIDVAAYADGSTHYAGLWGRSGTGTTAEVDTCAFTVTCRSGASFQCVTGDVHSFDSCGGDEGVYDNCASSEVCIDTSSTTATCSLSCGNGSVDSGEDCDGAALDGETCLSQGYDAGALGCSSSCSFDVSGCEFYTCGDGNVTSGEECDGSDLDGETCTSRGYDAGTLRCSSTCHYDVSSCESYTCGDGNVTSGEDCDGSDLDGATCASLGYDSGTLRCSSSCYYDTAGCANTEDCRDGVDNDGDGDEDCLDSDCDGDASCAPTISSTTCTSYGRGATATCTINGTNFLGTDNVYIGCFNMTSVTLSGTTRLTVAGDWICNCSLDYQDVSYRHPGSSSGSVCGDAYKACDTMSSSTTTGDARIDTVSPAYGYRGSSYSIYFTGCNLCSSGGTTATYIANVITSGASCSGSADQVVVTGDIGASAPTGIQDCAVAQGSGYACSDSEKDCITSCFEIR